MSSPSSSRMTLLSTPIFHLVLLFLSISLFSFTSAQETSQTATPSITTTNNATSTRTQSGASPTQTLSNNGTVTIDPSTNLTTIVSANNTYKYPIGTQIFLNSTVLFPNTTLLYPNGTYASLNGTQYALNGTVTYDPSAVEEVWNGTQEWLPFKIKIDAAYGVAGGFLILTGIPLAVLGGKNRW